MFRHGSDLYLVARTDPGGPFWSHDNPLWNTLPPWEHHLIDLVNFSFRQHGTAIWRLDQLTGDLEKLLELPGCGDTAFPSIVRLGENHICRLSCILPLVISLLIFYFLIVAGILLLEWIRNPNVIFPNGIALTAILPPKNTPQTFAA